MITFDFHFNVEYLELTVYCTFVMYTGTCDYQPNESTSLRCGQNLSGVAQYRYRGKHPYNRPISSLFVHTNLYILCILFAAFFIPFPIHTYKLLLLMTVHVHVMSVLIHTQSRCTCLYYIVCSSIIYRIVNYIFLVRTFIEYLWQEVLKTLTIQTMMSL